MKRMILSCFLVTGLCSTAFGIRLMPLYSFETRPVFDHSVNCGNKFHSVCWDGYVSVAEASDFEAMRKEIVVARDEVIRVLGKSQKEIFRSDEFRQIVRQIIYEEARKSR